MLLALVAFGPYVTSSLRLEHLLLYPLALVALFVLCLTRRLSPVLLPVMAGQLLLVFWIASSTFLSGRAPQPGAVFAALDNYLQPVAVLLVFMALPPAQRTLRTMETVMIVIVTLLALNTLAIFFQMATGASAIFGPWIPPPDEAGSTVWSRSLDLGRYCGIFAQPIEAGAMYSLGVLSCLYLALKRRAGLVLWSALGVLCAVGGVLSVSKIIILVGLPVAAAFLLTERYGRVILRKPWVVLTSAVAGVGGAVVLVNWSGFEYLTRLFTPRPGQNLLDLYTAGRLGGETDVLSKFNEVWTRAPLTGVGLFAFDVVDNGYLDVFSQGGLVGLALLALLLLYIFVRLGVHRRTLEARWTLFVFLFALLASVGGPVLTMNRFELVFWLLSAYVLTQAPTASRGVARPPAHGAHETTLS